MVAYLQKSEGSEGFHQIVNFLTASHISTLENGDMEITATIDGKVKVVYEASIRIHLKLEDSDGISDLPTIEIFEQLALMGFIQIFLNKHKRLLLPHKRLYIAPTLTQKLFSNMKRASKGYTGVDTPLFQTMLVQGQILQGEGSTIPVESHHTPTVGPSTSQPHYSPTLRDFIRQETEVPQPSSPTQTYVANEAASTGVDVRHGGAVTTISSLDTGHSSGNIDKTPAMPHDLHLPRVHTLRSDEGRMQHNELMDRVTKLSDRAVSLETDPQQTKKVYGAAYTKLIKKVKRLEDKLNKSRRKHRLVLSEEEDLDTKILAQEDPSKQGRKITQIDNDEGITLVQMGAQTQGRHDHEMEADFEFTTAKDVSTVNVPVNTVGAEISTANPKVKTAGVSVDDVAAECLVYIRRSAAKRKDKADEELAHKLQAQERERYSEANKAKLLVELINKRKRQFAQQRAQQRRNMPLTQAQQRSYMCNYIKHMGSHTLQQLRGYSFDEIKVLFEATVKRVNTFTPMKSDDTVPKVVTGSSKRSAEEELGEESSKRQKIGEGSEPAEESKDKESDELSQEQLQQLMIIVPEEGMNVEALQTKYPIIDWEVYTEDSRMYWKIIRVERFSLTEPTDDKERTLWVELKRLFEPDTDDLLELQRYMHDPLTWRLYDTCGVHHVSTERGHDIFMLVEKDYPLTRGLMTLMLCNKLQVDQHSKMADELLRKIFILVNRPRQRHFKTPSLGELRSPDFNLFSDQEYSEEEVSETMTETMEQYMSKTRADYGSGVARPKIEDKDNFKLKRPIS
ncbi:hypothetical protein Tco_0004275 [Tanacetum coccineum]